jgi:hypothetical protein
VRGNDLKIGKILGVEFSMTGWVTAIANQRTKPNSSTEIQLSTSQIMAQILIRKYLAIDASFICIL